MAKTVTIFHLYWLAPPNPSSVLACRHWVTLTAVEVPLPNPPTIRHLSMLHSDLVCRSEKIISAISLAFSCIA